MTAPEASRTSNSELKAKPGYLTKDEIDFKKAQHTEDHKLRHTPSVLVLCSLNRFIATRVMITSVIATIIPL